MQSVVRWCLRNKSVVVLAAVLLVASGVYATTRLNQELLPEIEFPLVTVSTPVPGAGPDLVDEQVSQSVASAVEGVEGVEGVSSNSAQGFSVVLVEFGFDADTEAAEAEINAALEDVSLPDGALEPTVQRFSGESFPIQSISLSASEGDLADLTGYAREEAVPLIEEVEGVASADLVGGSERQLEVSLDPDRLRAEGVPVEAVIGAISGSTLNFPAGNVRIDGLSTPVRATSGAANVEALRDLTVGVSGGSEAAAPPEGAAPSTATGSASGGGPPAGVVGGAPAATATGAPAGEAAPEAEPPEPVLLRDVAEVREVDADIAGISRTDGEPSLGINVIKEPDANTVEVAAGVEEALGQVREELGDDAVFVVQNSAEDVEASVLSLVEKAIIGGLLAVAIIFAFLRSIRATLITAVSLPTSILAALLFSWADDLTLNIITLAGLTIAVGRVVDDAIVVLENSYRYVQQGYGPEEAALRGTSEVASAITSSTLTTVAVFLPLGFVGGAVSIFFLPLSLTVAFALLASLLVAVTIIPVLVSLFIGRRSGRDENRAPRRDRPAEGEGGGRLANLYASALRWSLGHRIAVALLAVVVFAGGFSAVPFLPVSFFPADEERLVQADVELPAGTTLEGTAGELEPFEDFLLDDRGVESYQLSVGGENSADAESPLRGENQAQALVTISEGADVAATLERVRERGERLYGDDFQVQAISQGPPTGGLEVTLTGDDEEELSRASDLVVREVSGFDEVANVESGLSEVSPEIEVSVDGGRASEAGLSPPQVAGTLGTLLGGGQKIEVGEETVAVGVPEGATDSLDEVRGLPLGSDTTVSDVAEVEESEAPATVTRVDGERAVTISGTITGEDSGAVSGAVGEAVSALDLPDGVTATVGGESEDIQESFRDLVLAIFVALALVYLILVVFFGSLTVPLIILLSVPLITAGSFGALLVTNTALSLPSLLGVLLLIGIVVANAILLVDFAGKARSRHATVDEALVEAGRARLRPILMTALATIFALIPLALGVGFVEGGNSLISSSLAIPVIGGLITSTLLTLFVVPVGYSLLKAGRRRPSRDPEPPEGEPRDEPDGRGNTPLLPATEVLVGAGPTRNGSAGASLNGESPNGSSATALAVPGTGLPVGRGDELLYELGRARGQAEVLERELERRDRELSTSRRGESGGLGSLLRWRG